MRISGNIRWFPWLAIKSTGEKSVNLRVVAINQVFDLVSPGR